VVVVGAGQQLSISKQVSVVGGGAALPGSELEYVVRVANIAAVPAFSLVITDTLPSGQLAYVNGSATMNGSAAGVSVWAPRSPPTTGPRAGRWTRGEPSSSASGRSWMRACPWARW
jgi:uncharacterized repeat protein (TIGR01451 family)